MDTQPQEVPQLDAPEVNLPRFHVNPMKPQATPMRTKTRRSMMRFALRNKMPDQVLFAIATGQAGKAAVFGYHPTKRRS